MKANRKFIEADERAVSAVIGVILMFSVTVAISATAYYYITSMLFEEKDPVVLCGNIKYLPVENDWKKYGVLQMNDDCFYSIYFIGASDYALLKFAFQRNCTVSMVLCYLYDGFIKGKGDSVVLMDCGCNGDKNV